MSQINPPIEASWKLVLAEEFKKSYFKELKQFLVQEKEKKEIIYPSEKLIFNAFNRCHFGDLKLVIIGQDPYHGVGQAHGLCFSVPEKIKPPPSLMNIFKEINRDCQLPISSTGNLEEWANQGVLLLNTSLTVRAGQPASHSNKGWEIFTDKVIQTISEQKKNIVFLLWGKHAQKKRELIDGTRHCILMATHPSPFSAYRGFLGCGHFSQANHYLSQHGISTINWALKAK